MRLIDANGIQYTSFLKENWLENTSVEVEAVLRDEIDNMPTVEAIPIEWIETYMNRFTSSTQWAFKGMIQDWERKEE